MSELSKEVKLAIGAVVFLAVAFFAYKHFKKSYPPVTFQGQMFHHVVENEAANGAGKTSLYTLDGLPQVEASAAITIIDLNSKVRQKQLDILDKGLAMAMRLQEVPSHSDRMVGNDGRADHYLLMLERSYIAFSETSSGRSVDELIAESSTVFEELLALPAP